MASASFCFMMLSPLSSPSLRFSNGVNSSPSPSPMSVSLKNKLSPLMTISGSPFRVGPLPIPSSTSSQKRSNFIVYAKKGFKMKTHKASAKRFRVTGRGKIVRRRAGKQHLLEKKNKGRKRRLSKMHLVSKSDYNNVVGALPYLKVNRKAT